jgi:hypothetical protein
MVRLTTSSSFAGKSPPNGLIVVQMLQSVKCPREVVLDRALYVELTPRLTVMSIRRIWTELS